MPLLPPVTTATLPDKDERSSITIVVAPYCPTGKESRRPPVTVIPAKVGTQGRSRDGRPSAPAFRGVLKSRSPLDRRPVRLQRTGLSRGESGGQRERLKSLGAGFCGNDK